MRPGRKRSSGCAVLGQSDSIARSRWRAKRMKGVVCEAFGGPEVLALRELPDPPPPGAGEVQVRITARGVQYVDVLMLAGNYQFRPEPPFIPGDEGAGEVVAVGGRRRLQAGRPHHEPAPAGRLRPARQCSGRGLRPRAPGD